jgi:uncharacterized protein YdeI (YjbR/CyaY-like superfamily)
MPKPVSKSFSAVLERGKNRLNWVIVRIPFDAAKVWGSRGQLKVRGDINGFPFRTSLFPTGDGEHLLLVNKRMQASARVTVGDTAKLRLEPDAEERVMQIPGELAAILSEDRELSRWFEGVGYGVQKWTSDWINDVKSDEARQRRAEQMAERLLATMDAEVELPPVIRIAFARNPRAEDGWKRMSEGRRRTHLLGIFGYKDPASRARRIAKAVKEAFEVSERAGKKKSAL